MASAGSAARMIKLKHVSIGITGALFLTILLSLIMWSAGWVSARLYFADKIEKTPSVVQAPPQESIFVLVNKERRSAGLSNLYLDEKLINAARAKSCDMRSRGYFDHADPDGVKGWHFVDEQGVEWTDIGENLAKGNTDPAVLVQGWMESPAHRKNILDKKFRYTGYASCGEYTAQFFLR